MPGTTERARPGLSVRVRIVALVAALVTIALAGAGLIVYLVEIQRIETATEREVEQELDEFVNLKEALATSRPGIRTEDLLREFLRRNVPDDDELLVAWSGDRALAQFPADPLVARPEFVAIAQRLSTESDTAYLDTPDGEVRIRSQPVRQGDTTGALLVVTYLAEDRGELLSTIRTYAITAGLSALLITGAAGLAVGRLLRPLRSLRVTAEEIGATDLSRRIPGGASSRRDDITSLTHTVNGMLDRLETAFVGQRQFLDDAGHELRTPLTVLRGHLELLDAGDADEVEQTRALLVDEVDRMARLVGDLILLAKSDRPDFLSLEAVDPVDLTRSVVAKSRALGDRVWIHDLAPSAAAAQGSVGDNPVGDNPVGTNSGDNSVVIDEQRLTQALLQLADNAVKHTGDGDTVGIGVEVVGPTLRWWVRDTGRGVPVADRERIFERFGRSAVLPDDEGFGLGLSIVTAIAMAHGGRAYVTDPPASLGGLPGACFVLELPVVRPSSRPDDHPTP